MLGSWIPGADVCGLSCHKYVSVVCQHVSEVWHPVAFRPAEHSSACAQKQSAHSTANMHARCFCGLARVLWQSTNHTALWTVKFIWEMWNLQLCSPRVVKTVCH
jgi:hypothetical protein